MKIKFILLFILFSTHIVSIKTIAQTSDIEKTKSLFWEISENGLTENSYLFGTIHLIPEKDFFFSDTMLQKLLNCKTLALEILTDMPLKTQIEYAKKMMLPNGKTLKDYMQPNDFKRLESYIKDTLKIKEKKFNRYARFKPFFISSFLLVEVLGNTKSYELYLTKLAKKHKLNLIGIETIDYQLSVIDKITINEQVKMFAQENEVFNLLNEYNKLLSKYKQQDIYSLYTLMNTDDEFGNFKQEFLIDRNKEWIPIIEKNIKNQSTFIAVGAGHLAGEQGVINLLIKAGYSVKPIK